jgi:hypothetical protein
VAPAGNQRRFIIRPPFDVSLSSECAPRQNIITLSSGKGADLLTQLDRFTGKQSLKRGEQDMPITDAERSMSICFAISMM